MWGPQGQGSALGGHLDQVQQAGRALKRHKMSSSRYVQTSYFQSTHAPSPPRHEHMFNSALRAPSFFYFPANIFFFFPHFFLLSVFLLWPGHKTAFWSDTYNVPLNICQASHKWSVGRTRLIELNLKLCGLNGTRLS